MSDANNEKFSYSSEAVLARTHMSCGECEKDKTISMHYGFKAMERHYVEKHPGVAVLVGSVRDEPYAAFPCVCGKVFWDKVYYIRHVNQATDAACKNSNIDGELNPNFNQPARHILNYPRGSDYIPKKKQIAANADVVVVVDATDPVAQVQPSSSVTPKVMPSATSTLPVAVSSATPARTKRRKQPATGVTDPAIRKSLFSAINQLTAVTKSLVTLTERMVSGTPAAKRSRTTISPDISLSMQSETVQPAASTLLIDTAHSYADEDGRSISSEISASATCSVTKAAAPEIVVVDDNTAIAAVLVNKGLAAMVGELIPFCVHRNWHVMADLYKNKNHIDLLVSSGSEYEKKWSATLFSLLRSAPMYV
mgnify:CR=1 FL=1